MQPRKTDLARDALQAHRAPLDMRQRRLLIMCDGQRDIGQLTALIGPEAPAMVIQLIQAGYLVSVPEPAVEVVTPAPTDTMPERRRSVVAARIYLLGILELQRNPQAAALYRDLQMARAEGDVVTSLRTALEALPRMTSEGYSQRVRQRVLEALPLEHGEAM